LVKFTTSINRETGLLSLLFPGFSPIEALNAPPGASHFQLLSAGIAIDFEKRTSISDQQYSPVLPLNNDTVNSFELSNQLPPGSDEVLLLMAGIRFYTEVNNQYYPFEDKKYKSLDIVDVNQKGW
jgi:hypothetical protein